MTDESSGPTGSGIKLMNAVSLVTLDTACLAKESTTELGGVIFLNEPLPKNLTYLDDTKLDKT